MTAEKIVPVMVRQLLAPTASAVRAVFAGVSAEVRLRRGWPLTDEDMARLAEEYGVMPETIRNIEMRYAGSNADWYPDELRDTECDCCKQVIPAKTPLAIDYDDRDCPACQQPYGWQGYILCSDHPFDGFLDYLCSNTLTRWRMFYRNRAACPDSICLSCRNARISAEDVDYGKHECMDCVMGAIRRRAG